MESTTRTASIAKDAARLSPIESVQPQASNAIATVAKTTPERVDASIQTDVAPHIRITQMESTTRSASIAKDAARLSPIESVQPQASNAIATVAKTTPERVDASIQTDVAPAVSIPTLPNVAPAVSVLTLPNVAPDVSIPTLPNVAPHILPNIAPAVSIPTLPDVAPAVSIPTLPDVAPAVSIPTLPNVAPDVSIPTLPDVAPNVFPNVAAPILSAVQTDGEEIVGAAIQTEEEMDRVGAARLSPIESGQAQTSNTTETVAKTTPERVDASNETDTTTGREATIQTEEEMDRVGGGIGDWDGPPRVVIFPNLENSRIRNLRLEVNVSSAETIFVMPRMSTSTARSLQ